MTRPIGIRAAPRRELDQKSIEALDHADRISIGMIGLQHRQTVSVRATRLGDKYTGAFMA